MTTELIALGGGSALGFLFKMVSTLIQAQTSLTDNLITKQKQADDSADKASARSAGSWVRRMIVVTTLFALVIAPFILAHSPEGITVGSEKNFLFLSWTSWKTLSGFVILPEIRQTLMAIVGFYFGSSSFTK